MLAYNLLLDGDTTASVAGRVGAATAHRLAHLLDEHFFTQLAARYAGADRDPPTRLVYLLDHEYTERGLSWARLKGSDADRAAALSAAGEAVLALAGVHETWQAYDEPEPYWHRGYGRDDHDEEEYGDGSSGEPQLQELIESTVHLDHWLSDPGSPGSPTSLTIDDDDVCATTPSVSLTPYSAEYEPMHRVADEDAGVAVDHDVAVHERRAQHYPLLILPGAHDHPDRLAGDQHRTRPLAHLHQRHALPLPSRVRSSLRPTAASPPARDRAVRAPAGRAPRSLAPGGARA